MPEINGNTINTAPMLNQFFVFVNLLTSKHHYSGSKGGGMAIFVTK